MYLMIPSTKLDKNVQLGCTTWLPELKIEISLNHSKEEDNDNTIPHLTQDTIWESDKNTRTHHKQESQEVSSFPAGDHKEQTRQYDTKHKKDIQESAALEWSVR